MDLNWSGCSSAGEPIRRALQYSRRLRGSVVASGDGAALPPLQSLELRQQDAATLDNNRAV